MEENGEDKRGNVPLDWGTSDDVGNTPEPTKSPVIDTISQEEEKALYKGLPKPIRIFVDKYANSGKSKTQIARECDIDRKTVHNWLLKLEVREILNYRELGFLQRQEAAMSKIVNNMKRPDNAESGSKEVLIADLERIQGQAEATNQLNVGVSCVKLIAELSGHLKDQAPAASQSVNLMFNLAPSDPA